MCRIDPNAYVPKKDKGGIGSVFSKLKESLAGKTYTDEELDAMMSVEDVDFLLSNNDVILAKPGTVV